MVMRKFFFSTIRQAVLGPPFISTWRTTNTSTGSSTSTQVKLPLISAGTYDFVVDWGDGNDDVITAWNQAETTHTYAATGDYTVTITGTCTGWSFAATGDRLKILTISQWGALIVSSVSNQNAGVFTNCTNLNVTATDIPDFTGVTALSGFFRGCSSLIYNSSINSWDISSIISIDGMFRSSTSFNQNIGGWDVTSVNTMLAMFTGATAFNNGGSSDINNWVTSSLTVMNGADLGMFYLATSFNQNIGAWDVSGVASFRDMFRNATAFNNGGSSDINNWVTTSLNNLLRTFLNASNFNQPINNWNVSNVTSFLGTFQSAIAFNQNIGSWNISSATNTTQMFSSATNFNNGGSSTIDNWDVSNVLLFGGTNAGMFLSASSFNQPIGNWNTSSATNMRQMLEKATNFDQNIGGWNVSNVTDFTNFMLSKTNLDYSAANLDAIYNGWTNISLSVSEAISFSTIKYTAAATAARALLTRTNTTVAISNAVNNGAGLIRITSAAHGRTTGDKVFISGVLGTTEANGGWIVTVIDATTIDLQASTFTNTYISGGTLRTGYGWTITDGGL